MLPSATQKRTMTEHSAGNTHQRYGVFVLGRGCVALPIEWIREVVALPHDLTPAPRSPAFSLGSFQLRDHALPVVDLTRLLRLDDSSGTRPAGDPVAVIAHPHGRFGLRIDSVLGIARPDRLSPMTDSGDPPLVTATLTAFEKTAHVLDIEALFALEGMLRALPALAPASAERPVTEAPASREKVLVVECAGIRLALPTACIRETQPLGPLEAPVVNIEGFMGAARLRKARIAVFNPLRLAWLEPACAPTHQLMLVLVLQQHPVALAIDRVILMIEYDPASLVDPAYSQLEEGIAIAGTIHHDHLGDILLINHRHMAQDPDLVAIAAMYSARELQNERQGGDTWKRFAFIDFDASGSFLTPLEQIDEVLDMPADYTPNQQIDGFWTGSMRLREHAVSLVDLRQLLKPEAATVKPASHVLVATHGSSRVGFMVDNAHRIRYIDAPADSLRVRWWGDQESDAALIERCKRLAVLGLGKQQQVLSILCLESLAALLLGGDIKDRCLNIPESPVLPR